ncbi:bifunctional 4-hydroxy-2-oxoglutarate aldolase/2-dehydro-3-deoxy-phosphogluconate aldolase [Pleurocapsales cyanobacterium LEGE 06147]|nr:bifunctional 4-hydroxy-2-oxoglutarate aldolase/2-dehydro-3-deoxy-phosphogluconate aldolase [Pleurocapsales cyanobacterium LEGE 06147]
MTPLNVSNSWQQLLLLHRAIAVIRSPRWEIGLAMAQAVAAGGIKLIEITWNSDRPEALISQLREELPDCQIGAGTILELQQLKEAIACGAEFIFCPHLNYTILEVAVNNYHIPLVPGALSPTEIVNAWQAGASAVKVFPIQVMGGANYLRSLQGPLGYIPLIPTGGVTPDNAKEMLTAGAIAVGLSSHLFPKSLVMSEDWHTITQRTQTLLASLPNREASRVQNSYPKTGI